MITLSNINNEFASYQQLINLFENHKDKRFNTISISLTNWFAANMCSALGGILDLLQNNLNEIKFEYLDSSIETILKKNNFLSYYGHLQMLDNHRTTIQYLKLKPTDGKYFKDYIFNELLARNEMPNMSKAVKDAIAEGIYEIYVNAQMHSQTKTIFTCGQFFPNKNKIEFTITDVGVGFKNKVNNRFNSKLNAAQAIKWAVQDKNTTKIDTPGGIGLAKLTEFLKTNEGKLQIISNEGFYQFGNDGEKTGSFIGEFPGTVVNLQFSTDDSKSYSLKEEINIDNIF